MAGCHEVDVMAAQLLQAEHPVGQLFRRDRLPLRFPTDLEVLAEDAAKVAVAEENGAGAAAGPAGSPLRRGGETRVLTTASRPVRQ